MPSAEAGGPPGDDLPVFTPTGEETVHRGWVIRVQRATFLDPDGVAFERDIVRHPGAVAVVAVTERDTVVLVRQYRPAVDRWHARIALESLNPERERLFALFHSKKKRLMPFAPATAAGIEHNGNILLT